LIGAALLGKYLIATGPQAKKKPFVRSLPVVEVVTLKARDYTVNLKASGIVRAGTQTNLVSEVSGRILQISDRFNEGSYFNKGDNLLTIDAENYENSLAIAKSDVAVNRAALSQLVEEEKSTKRSYKLVKKNLKLGKSEVNRKRLLWQKKLIARSVVDAEEQKQNQLQQRNEETLGKLNTFKSRKLAIKAKINAALSRLKQEELNLSRTVITAPYDGRVLQKMVDVGQFVGKGANLGKVYATDFVTVDLPLSLNQYELLGIPESFRNETSKSKDLPKVTFKSTNSRHQSTWQGQVVRTSAALDAGSRQIKVIARIDKPFVANENVSAPVRIGQYLDAKIVGKTFKDSYVLSSSSVRQNKEVLLLKDGKIHIVPVQVLFNTSKETIVKPKENIEGELLVITSMNQAGEGTEVITPQQQLEQQKKKKKKMKVPEKELQSKNNTQLQVAS